MERKFEGPHGQITPTFLERGSEKAELNSLPVFVTRTTLKALIGYSSLRQISNEVRHEAKPHQTRPAIRTGDQQDDQP